MKKLLMMIGTAADLTAKALAAAGHYRLDVSDAGVSVAFYGGDATTPSQTFQLR